MKTQRENASLLRRLVNAIVKEQEIWKTINYAVENDEVG